MHYFNKDAGEGDDSIESVVESPGILAAVILGGVIVVGLTTAFFIFIIILIKKRPNSRFQNNCNNMIVRLFGVHRDKYY